MKAWKFFVLVIAGLYLSSFLISGIVFLWPGKILLTVDVIAFAEYSSWALAVAMALLSVGTILLTDNQPNWKNALLIINSSASSAITIRALPFEIYPIPGVNFSIMAVVATVWVIIAIWLATESIIHGFTFRKAAIIVSVLSPALLISWALIISPWFIQYVLPAGQSL